MKLDANVKEAILSRAITYDELTKWQAFRIIGDLQREEAAYAESLNISDLKSEDDFRKWSGFDKTESVTVEDALKVKIAPHLVFWTLLREEILPEAFIHALSLDHCRDFLDRLAKEGAYIDYRFSRFLETKQRWLDTDVSLGELRAVQRKAHETYVDSHESDDKQIKASAYAVYSATLDDSLAGVRGVFEAVAWVYNANTEYERRLKRLRKTLGR